MTSEARSLSVADVLKSIGNDIQAEHALIASRATWYVMSQAFFLTAYATSWNPGFQWPAFFHVVLPIAALVLSAVILISIYAATWAQDMYLREQSALVARIKAQTSLSCAETIALEAYARTIVANRTDAAGRVIGRRIHGLVRITPLLLPIGFGVLWCY